MRLSSKRWHSCNVEVMSPWACWKHALLITSDMLRPLLIIFCPIKLFQLRHNISFQIPTQVQLEENVSTTVIITLLRNHLLVLTNVLLTFRPADTCVPMALLFEGILFFYYCLFLWPLLVDESSSCIMYFLDVAWIVTNGFHHQQ